MDEQITDLEKSLISSLVGEQVIMQIPKKTISLQKDKVISITLGNMQGAYDLNYPTPKLIVPFKACPTLSLNNEDNIISDSSYESSIPKCDKTLPLNKNKAAINEDNVSLFNEDDALKPNKSKEIACNKDKKLNVNEYKKSAFEECKGTSMNEYKLPLLFHSDEPLVNGNGELLKGKYTSSLPYPEYEDSPTNECIISPNKDKEWEKNEDEIPLLNERKDEEGLVREVETPRTRSKEDESVQDEAERIYNEIRSQIALIEQASREDILSEIPKENPKTKQADKKKKSIQIDSPKLKKKKIDDHSILNIDDLKEYNNKAKPHNNQHINTVSVSNDISKTNKEYETTLNKNKKQHLNSQLSLLNVPKGKKSHKATEEEVVKETLKQKAWRLLKAMSPLMVHQILEGKCSLDVLMLWKKQMGQGFLLDKNGDEIYLPFPELEKEVLKWVKEQNTMGKIVSMEDIMRVGSQLAKGMEKPKDFAFTFAWVKRFVTTHLQQIN